MPDDQLAAFERGDETTSSEGDNSPVEWRGLPKFEAKDKAVRLVISFDTEKQRDELVAQLGLILAKKTKGTWSAWWPPRAKEDLSALRFDFGDEEC